jgi:hypothetical protein
MESRSIFGIFSCNKDQGLINLNAVFCHQPRCAHPRAPLHSGKFPFVRTFCLSYWIRYLHIEYITFKIHIINFINESIIIRFCHIISWRAVTLSLLTKMTSIMMSWTLSVYLFVLTVRNIRIRLCFYIEFCFVLWFLIEREEVFLFSKASRSTLVSTQPSTQCAPGALSSGLNQL